MNHITRKMISRAPIALFTCLLLGLVNAAQASVIAVASGYEVRYRMQLDAATPTGEDIINAIIFEWNGAQQSATFPYTIAGSGRTELSHIIPFAPTSALVIGYLDAKPGIGDEKRHLYTLLDIGFSNHLVQDLVGTGAKFSEIFGQGEQFTIDLLIAAAHGSASESALAIDALWSFVTGGAADAAFDPAGGFRIHKWSIVEPPSGGNIPAPATLTLLSLGLAGLGIARRKKPGASPPGA